MTLSEAIYTRSSIRSYLPGPLAPSQRRQLEKSICQLNRRSGLHFRLVCGESAPFSAFPKSRLRDACSYLLLSGPREDPHLGEKCGYFGEELALTAVSMGLGTCWVGGTYDKKRCQRHLSPGEELTCVITLGRQRERPPERALKPSAELSSAPEDAPAWFSSGIAAVQRAPSALNRQDYRFSYQCDGTVRARSTAESPFARVDLGIAKLHFELGAHGGQWTWGEGGVFHKAAEEKSCGAVVWREAEGRRQYLLARHNGGHWSFPKGHVEGRETEEETARREIREETGLTAVTDSGFRSQVTYYPRPGVVKDVIFFTARPVEGREHAQESEISEIGWFSLQEARSLITYASDEEVLMAADAYLSEKRTSV